MPKKLQVFPHARNLTNRSEKIGVVRSGNGPSIDSEGKVHLSLTISSQPLALDGDVLTTDFSEGQINLENQTSRVLDHYRNDNR